MKSISFILSIQCFLFVISISHGQQVFRPVPDSLTHLYKFDLEKNFFQTERDFKVFLNGFSRDIDNFQRNLNKRATVRNLEELTISVSQLEFDFRKMDLYLFLKYATNTKNTKASILEDSIYTVMLKQRSMYRNYVNTTSSNTIEKLLKTQSMSPFQYFIKSIIRGKSHELSQTDLNLLKPFNYLKSNQYYDYLVNSLPTYTIVTSTDTLDLFKNMGDWENHTDSSVRSQGQKKLYESYNTVKNPLGYHYIQMIKGLNAFSKTKNFENIIEENCDKIYLSQPVLESIFNEIESNASLFTNFEIENFKEIEQYDIKTGTDILLQSFEQLGQSYHNKANQLLNPLNGRLDIVGRENKMRMRGVASVYPIDVSIFYSNNYEGYFIDLMLLAHEAGHAIQASLMNENKVSMLNASGPGYFTESFGKFNELLVAYYLLENSKGSSERKFYSAKYLERLLVLFGSTAEAAIEYHLVTGIISDNITTPKELDSITFLIGNKYTDYSNSLEQKGLWMILETNFKMPLHNINDMMASLLAIHYFKQFLKNKAEFSDKFNAFLRNGYTESPNTLLLKFMEINFSDSQFCKEAIEFIKQEYTNHSNK